MQSKNHQTGITNINQIIWELENMFYVKGKNVKACPFSRTQEIKFLD